jgi:choline dehydrogenase-like flavoprotein
MLRSADPRERVLIDQNFLAVDSDLKTLREGLKLLREVAARQALDPFRGREIRPGSDVRSDAELDSYIRSAPATAHHPCGTCRMGSDEDAVVDGKLRLRGLSGLRVVDASVMPDLVGGNINATVIMIAEKAAELIARPTTPRPAQAAPAMQTAT